MVNAVTIKYDDKGIDRQLDRITEESNKAVRPAAQAGAEDMYYHVRLLCPQSAEAHFFSGRDYKKTGVRYLFTPGTLRDSIYQVYSKDNSAKERATYHVSWNHVKAPYGFMVEFGTSKSPPHSFVRRAYDERKVESAQIVKAEYESRMRAVL